MNTDENKYTVYVHTSPNGKKYVGITARNVKRRWHGGSGYRSNKHFYSAIKKYGWDSFAHEIVAENLTLRDACEEEIKLIELYKSYLPENGYNVSMGGDKTTLGYKMSQEIRDKISAALKGKTKGRPFTEEHKRNISNALKGKKASQETKNKLRESLGDRFKKEEVAKKRNENHPRGSSHPLAKAVVCVETNDAFGLIDEAAKKYNLSRSSISAACRGKQKTAGGLHWRYAG